MTISSSLLLMSNDKKKEIRAIQTENKVKNGLKVIKLRYRKIDSKLGFFCKEFELVSKEGEKDKRGRMKEIFR